MSTRAGTDGGTHGGRVISILFAVAALLLIPFVAMQFTDEVNWTVSDFVVMGALLLATGLGSELVMRKVTDRQNRAIIIAAILAAFLLVWADLAVGIFNIPGISGS